MEPTLSEKQIESCGWKSLDFLHHSEKSQSLAIWFRLRHTTTMCTTKTYAAFSGEPDERREIRHRRTIVRVFFMTEQLSSQVTWCRSPEYMFMAIFNGTIVLSKHNFQKTVFWVGCVQAMIMNLGPLQLHIFRIGDKSAIWNDATNTVLIVIPVNWPSSWDSWRHC